MKNIRSKFSIGRDRGCDILIADDSVSRVHAELLLLEDGSIILRDCGSSNGTRLLRKGVPRPVVQEAVSESDQVQFGDASISVAELLAAAQQKLHPSKAPARNLSATPGPSASKATKLVRCGCGTIKPVNKPCPECHQ